MFYSITILAPKTEPIVSLLTCRFKACSVGFLKVSMC